MQDNKNISFRDRPLALDKSGNKKWIYAKQPKGKWYTRRTFFAWCCILFLMFAPIIKIGENPLMLFDVVHRKIYIFGQLIWAQDTYLLALIMLITVISIVLFTVVYGRLWCGWACPQTIFMEMIFRRIEYAFDGKRNKNSKQKFKFTSIAKHFAFFLTSIVLTHIFINWFIGLDKLIEIVTSPIKENVLGFAFMLGISIFYYSVYAYFREQVCTMFCPYGRMQGVLLDSKSISVIYNYKRGEPRGAHDYGDCINCKQCIAVCPTGIDIKNGSQLECINCTACIDECNSVMKRIGKPENLIRYDSVHGIETGNRTILNTRAIAYSVVLVILLIVLVFTLSKRTAIDSTVLRVPGTIYQVVEPGILSNIYNIKIINKTSQKKELSLKLLSHPDGTIEFASPNHTLAQDSKIESIVIIKLNEKQLMDKNTPIEIGIFEGEQMLESYKTNFIGP